MPERPPNKNKKVGNSLVALSSAAVLTVYAAGYTRTRAAANRLDTQSDQRRPAVPAQPPPAVPRAEVQPAPAVPLAAAETPKPIHVAELVAKAEPVKAGLPENAPAPVETPVQSLPSAPVVNQAAQPPAPVPEPKPELAAAPPKPPTPVWKDGTYTGWGTSRHGDIQASVVIEGGRIASATIAQCLTRYSCSVIEKLPPQVAQRQSPEIDYVSGATQSTNAFYYGVVDALSKAK